MARPLTLILCALLLLSGGRTLRAQSTRADAPDPKMSAALQMPIRNAIALIQAKKYAESLQALEAAQLTARNAKDLTAEATVLELKALVLVELKQERNAHQAWQEEIAVLVQAGDSIGQVRALGLEAVWLRSLQPAETKALEERSLALAKAERVRPLKAAKALQSIGNDLYAQDRNGEAETFLQAARALFESLHDSSLSYANCLLQLTNLSLPRILTSSASVNHVELQNNMRQAVAIFERELPNEDLAFCYLLLGILYALDTDFDAAEAYMQRALDIFDAFAPDSDTAAVPLTFLAMFARLHGHLPQADRYYRLAKSSLEAAAKRRGNASNEYRFLQNTLNLSFGQTASLDAQMRQSAQDMGISDEAMDAIQNSVIGIKEAKAGKLSDAQLHIEEANRLLHKAVPNSLWEADTLINLAFICYKQGRAKEGEAYGQAAWNIVRAYTGEVSGTETRRAFQRYFVVAGDNLLCCQLAQGKKEAAFATLEQSRAQSLLNLATDPLLLKTNRHSALALRYQTARQQEIATRPELTRAALQRDKLEKEKAGFERLAAQGNASSTLLAGVDAEMKMCIQRYDKAFQMNTQASRETENCWRSLRETFPARMTLPPLTYPHARDSLPKGMLFVGFSFGEEQVHLFLLSYDQPLQTYTLQTRAADLQTRIHAFRDLLANKNAPPDKLATAGNALFSMLFPPDAQTTLRKARRLLISPDGPLWDVSFAALPITVPAVNMSSTLMRSKAIRTETKASHRSQEQQEYLGLFKPITYIPSLTAFAAVCKERTPLTPGKKPAALVLGNPLLPASHPVAPLLNNALALSEERGGKTLGLPESDWEAHEIASLYDVTPLLREQATEANLRQRIGGADIVHIAAHGIFSPYSPLGSSISLSLPAQGFRKDKMDDDGMLQAWEIVDQLHLKARLVVLSACESGRGEALHGAGIIGFMQALQVAGCRSSVGSLALVNSDSTKTLMVAFHKNLRARMSEDVALQQAMRTVHNQLTTSSPYFWGTFFLVGDPDALQFKPGH